MRKTYDEWEKYFNMECDDIPEEEFNRFEVEYVKDWNWYIRRYKLKSWQKIFVRNNYNLNIM